MSWTRQPSTILDSLTCLPCPLKPPPQAVTLPPPTTAVPDSAHFGSCLHYRSTSSSTYHLILLSICNQPSHPRSDSYCTLDRLLTRLDSTLHAAAAKAVQPRRGTCLLYQSSSRVLLSLASSPSALASIHPSQSWCCSHSHSHSLSSKQQKSFTICIFTQALRASNHGPSRGQVPLGPQPHRRPSSSISHQPDWTP